MTPENKPQTAWSIINFESGKFKNKNHTPLMLRSDKTFFQINSAAEAFNDYFLNVIEKLNIEDVNNNSALLSFNKLSSQDFPVTTIIPIMEVEIICTFASLKNKNLSVYDGISNRILKFCGKFLGKPSTHIFNKWLTVGKFPDHLKYSVVNPLFKKGKKSELTSYRPISLLTGFSRFLNY
jgi:hypothetical protein